MKSKYITTIILEGTDGVGKTTITHELFKIYNYRYMVYHRGEMSNLFYAMKYNRPFSQTQCGLPFLHILLICDKNELKKRITERNLDVKVELSKIDDQDKFIKLARNMEKDYHILICDTTNLTPEETGLKLRGMIDKYVRNLEIDRKLSEWNEMYLKGCNKLNLPFVVRDNQLYINDILTMSEYTLQNGVYEEYTNKNYPDNLIFMLGYSEKLVLKKKDIDFAYVINSKILKRPEVYRYYEVFEEAGKTFLTSNNPKLIPDYKHQIKMDRVFGNKFIMELSRCKATVYTSRDLASRKLQTARLYEAIKAKQIVFVDEMTDIDKEILSQIYGNDDYKGTKFIDLMTVTPETIIDKYNYILKNDLTSVILKYQTNFYKNLLKELSNPDFNHYLRK